MSIESILLEYFIALKKADINSTTPSYQGHALFHFFIYLMIENRMLTVIIHTVIVYFNLSIEKNYQQHHWVKYWTTLMVVTNNTDVPMHCTLCQLCFNVNQLLLIEA